jgi:hypothetical protein
VPAEAAGAVLGALHQAMVNSVAHAGADARRSVSVIVAGDGLTLTAADDGRGFDVAKVPQNRLGIATSIVGRMRAVAGGDAVVTSRPGEGTTVVLRWSVPRDSRPGAARTTAEDSSLWGRSSTALGVLAGAFGLSQLALAGYLALQSARPWQPLTAAAGILTALSVLGWTRADPPRRGTAAAVAAVVVATAFVSLAAEPHGGFQFADTWYVASGGFVLALLGLRGRSTAAIVGLGCLLAVFLAGVALHHNADMQLPAAITRPAVTVLGACLLGWAVSTMRRSTVRLRTAELTAHEDEAWATAMGAELHRHSVELAERVGPMLARVEEGRPLDAAEAGECLALEGALRDELRGGRLAREPLATAAADARRRGVDVVLIDDVPERAIPDPVLGELAAWLGERLSDVGAGAFVARILPEGAGPVAVAAAGGETTSFGG